jgi:hypothetical protein
MLSVAAGAVGAVGATAPKYTRLRYDLAFAGIDLQITSGKGRNDLPSHEGEGETHK